MRDGKKIKAFVIESGKNIFSAKLDRTFLWNTLEVFLVLSLAALPLTYATPFFRDFAWVWEGAYRLLIGQTPYKDFGMPVGPGILILPYVFFKLNGPSFYSLKLAAAVVSLIALLSFNIYLRFFQVRRSIRTSATLLFGLTYTTSSSLPWYNQTAFAFELAGITCLLGYLLPVNELRRSKLLRLLLLNMGGLFLALAITTKQDYGGIGWVFALILCSAEAYRQRNIYLLAQPFLVSLLFIVIIHLPHIGNDFFYWYNYGQPPHTSKLTLDILKFRPALSRTQLAYFLVVAYLTWFLRNSQFVINRCPHRLTFALLTLGLIVQSYITATTSSRTQDSATYFFAPTIAFILSDISRFLRVRQTAYLNFFIIPLLVMFVYIPSPFLFVRNLMNQSPLGMHETCANRTCIRPDLAGLNAFGSQYLPVETVKGINEARKFLNDSEKECSVLNMTELTPLIKEWNFTPCTGFPLWYDYKVSLFSREVKKLVHDIKLHRFELVLYQDTHQVISPFPPNIRYALQKEYELRLVFLAPRKETPIEVYTPRKSN